MQKKIDILREKMAAGDWHGAICLAAKFPRLGSHKSQITRAKDAITNPRFVSQLGREPKAVIEEGIAALIDRYQKNHSGLN